MGDIDNGYMVEVDRVSFRYQNSAKPVLTDINLGVRRGQVVGIVGLSGSGKTTLMNILNGIIPRRINGDFQGRVLLNGQEITEKDVFELSTVIATVFQDPDSQIVFSSVEDEIAFGPENLCVPPDEILQRIDDITELLQIENLRYRNPNNLSGGEKQLVVIASVLSLNVEILILDECMAQIDNKGRQLIMAAIKNLRDSGKTIIMVEHDFSNLAYADQIYLLADGRLKPYDGVLQ